MKTDTSIPRILQVFTVLDRGGAETMIMNYYRQIDRSKLQFDFLVHREEKGAYEDEIESLGGKIYRMPQINPLFPHKYYKELDKFLKVNNYKVIHSHINTFSRYPLKAAFQNGIKGRLVHAHTTTNPINVKMVLNKPFEAFKIIYKNFQKINIAKYATHKFSCGEKAGNWLYGKNSDFRIISNAIDTMKYSYNYEISENLKKEFDLENCLVLGHIGNFSYAKNYPFILSVFKSLKTIKSNSKLVLIGNGKLRKEIEALAIELGIYNDILFLGVRSDVFEVLQMIDVFIFPSHYEGLPVTLVEAQAAGLKIFASDTITDEVALTDDITFLSLDKSPEFWAEQILKSYPYERKDNSEIIKVKGYDIVDSAKKLQDFYLDQILDIKNELAL